VLETINLNVIRELYNDSLQKM